MTRKAHSHVQRRAKQAGIPQGRRGDGGRRPRRDGSSRGCGGTGPGSDRPGIDEQGSTVSRRACHRPAASAPGRGKHHADPVVRVGGLPGRVHGRQRHGGEERAAEHQHPDHPGSGRLRNAGDVEYRPAHRGRRRKRRRQPGYGVSHRSTTGAGRRGGDHARRLDGSGERVWRQGRGDGAQGSHGGPDQGGGGRPPGRGAS